MSNRKKKLIVLGLSLSSSWGNGHATTYRALLRALAGLRYDILFLERDVPWYAANRDLPNPDYCGLELYGSVGDLGRYTDAIAAADAVMVGSYVPDAIAVGELVCRTAEGVTVFYDIDTPVTLADLSAGCCAYISRALIPAYDLYLSFTGGPTLGRLERDFGARQAQPLYCSVDPERYMPRAVQRRWDLGYLGTYSEDRQPALERMLIEPARRLPKRRFVVAGAQYPASLRWPANVDYIPHLPPTEHPAFYCSLGWTLNITRAAMRAAGYSPSVRLFEAAACGVPIISDSWAGMDTALRPGSEILVADTTEDVVAALGVPHVSRRSIAAAARARVLGEHTSGHRARELARYLSGRARTRAQGVLEGGGSQRPAKEVAGPHKRDAGAVRGLLVGR